MSFYTEGCRAKNPSTCPYHGAVLRAETALKKGDAEGYLKARKEADDQRNHKEKISLKGLLSGEEAPDNARTHVYIIRHLEASKRLAEIDARIAEIDTELTTRRQKPTN